MRTLRLLGSCVLLVLVTGCAAASSSSLGATASNRSLASPVSSSPGMGPPQPAGPPGGCDAIQPNPWGFSFCGPGPRVTRGPQTFCSVFQCVPDFWKMKGYIVQCAGGEYSHAGGVPGACFFHGGVSHVVYSRGSA